MCVHVFLCICVYVYFFICMHAYLCASTYMGRVIHSVENVTDVREKSDLTFKTGMIGCPHAGEYG